MKTKKTSLFANGLIWFGAGVSLAEIITGTLFAPLGFTKGLLAVLLGHIIGAAMLFLAGLIGARTEKSAMETVKLSFGQKGCLLFAVLNVTQLVGWTAIMIYEAPLPRLASSPAGRGFGASSSAHSLCYGSSSVSRTSIRSILSPWRRCLYSR